MEVKNIVKFLERTYPNEESAKEFFVSKRWPDGVICPKCAGDKVNKVNRSMPYKCRPCNKYFSVKTKTFMESSKLTLRQWLIVMFFMGSSKHGISSLQLADTLGIQPNTAWYACQRVRMACQNPGGKLDGTVEVDETYFGGKERNKHSVKRLRSGRGIANKTPVLGVKQRGGVVVARVVPNTKRGTLQSFIKQNVEAGAEVITDEHRSYIGLNKTYDHKTVNHSAGQYVDGNTHTNSIESFWASLKRRVYGTHHHVSSRYLQRYVDEATFRASTDDFIGDVCSNSEVGVA